MLPLEGDEKAATMPPLEDDKEKYRVTSKSLSKGVKKGKSLKVVTPKKLLTRLKIRQRVHLLYQHNKITKTLCNNLIKSL